MTHYSENLQVSLNAVTPVASPGTTGTTVDLGAITDEYLLYVEFSGGNANIAFNGSLDGSTWYQVASSTNVTGVRAPSSPTLPARYLQAVAILGSGSPVVTASAASAVGN